jgi:3-methyladenine DNA glycosylase AlkD
MSAIGDEILASLQTLANTENVAGMARYGINPQGTLGISLYTLRPMAKKIGQNHELALELWEAGIHEARLLAVFIDDPGQVTPEQMDRWAGDFDSWDICDQACTSLFDQTPHAYAKAYEWSADRREFVKRGGFVLMAGLAVHDRTASDDILAGFFPVIVRESDDNRNFVKKAVNWALRNLGKRNLHLNALAVETANQVAQRGMPAARWIAADALRELTAEKTIQRLQKKRLP